MKLVFLGTRGEIETRTDRHRRHTATEVSYGGRRVMVDCGEDWRGKLHDLRPLAVVVTHAHPDHAWGLKDGAPCPVWATGDAWEEMEDYPLEERHTVEVREPFETWSTSTSGRMHCGSVTSTLEMVPPSTALSSASGATT